MRDLQISKMAMALTLTDYRVRQEICSAMAARIFDTPTTLLGRCEPCLRRTAFQLAVCYKLGFGVPADHEKAVDCLVKSERTESDLRDETLRVKQISGLGFVDPQSRPAKMVNDGIIVIWDFVGDYCRKGLKLNVVRDYHLRELSDMERELGDDSDVARMLKAVLAKVYAFEGDFKNAERLRRELLQTSISKFGDKGLDTLYAKENLGGILLGTGEITEAEGLLQSAFAGLSSILGESHLATLTAHARWCDTVYLRGRYAEVMPIYRGIYYKIIELLGVEHPESVSAMANWASAVGAIGDFGLSKELHKNVLSMRESILGPRHEITLNSRTTVASALRSLGSYAEAEQMHQSALEGFEEVEGASRANILAALEEFTLTLEIQHKSQEAEVLRRRARRLVSEMQSDKKIEDHHA